METWWCNGSPFPLWSFMCYLARFCKVVLWSAQDSSVSSCEPRTHISRSIFLQRCIRRRWTTVLYHWSIDGLYLICQVDIEPSNSQPSWLLFCLLASNVISLIFLCVMGYKWSFAKQSLFSYMYSLWIFTLFYGWRFSHLFIALFCKSFCCLVRSPVFICVLECDQLLLIFHSKSVLCPLSPGGLEICCCLVVAASTLSYPP